MNIINKSVQEILRSGQDELRNIKQRFQQRQG